MIGRCSLAARNGQRPGHVHVVVRSVYVSESSRVSVPEPGIAVRPVRLPPPERSACGPGVGGASAAFATVVRAGADRRGEPVSVGHPQSVQAGEALRQKPAAWDR